MDENTFSTLIKHFTEFKLFLNIKGVKEMFSNIAKYI